jgi:multidrug efflux pump subunit AcrA (membrane-fusion protein)
MSDPADNSHSSSGAPPDALPVSDEQRGVAYEQPKGRALAIPRWLDWRIASVLLLATISIPIWRLVTNHAKAFTAPTLASPAQPVAVARVSREDLFNEITIPAEFRPYLKVELHAKVSGYVDQINVDIGDQVKAGQLLAKLEVPELKTNSTAQWRRKRERRPITRTRTWSTLVW